MSTTWYILRHREAELWCKGNAATAMGGKMAHGVMQADGTIAEEPVMDVSNVADSIVYVAGLPAGVNVLVSEPRSASG